MFEEDQAAAARVLARANEEGASRDATLESLSRQMAEANERETALQIETETLGQRLAGAKTAAAAGSAASAALAKMKLSFEGAQQQVAVRVESNK